MRLYRSMRRTCIEDTGFAWHLMSQHLVKNNFSLLDDGHKLKTVITISAYVRFRTMAEIMVIHHRLIKL